MSAWHITNCLNISIQCPMRFFVSPSSLVCANMDKLWCGKETLTYQYASWWSLHQCRGSQRWCFGSAHNWKTMIFEANSVIYQTKFLVSRLFWNRSCNVCLPRSAIDGKILVEQRSLPCLSGFSQQSRWTSRTRGIVHHSTECPKAELLRQGHVRILMDNKKFQEAYFRLTNANTIPILV